MKLRQSESTGVERTLPPRHYIISTTDTHGRITSVNDVFVEFSGYPAEELLGRQHNVVRHPDMPRAIFWLAWDALLAGEDFCGYMKNLSKDGSHYWVFSHIRPVHDAEGEITGFRSVRRHAAPKAIAKIAELYARMLEAEKAAGPKAAIDAGLTVFKAHLAEQAISYEGFIATLS